MAAAKVAAPVLMIAALLVLAAVFVPDGDPPRATPSPTPTASPAPDILEPAVAVLVAGLEADGIRSISRPLYERGLRVVVRPATRLREGTVILVNRAGRRRLARRLGRDGLAPVRVVDATGLRRAGAPPEADIAVVAGRRVP